VAMLRSRAQAPSATTQRLEAFSDGVIAIAITLLVLEISVPDAPEGKLFDQLLDNWASYAAFALSFVVIGIMWVSHHSMFERIARVDRGLLFSNLLLLLGIAFLPFPTALLAAYVEDGGSNASVAAAIYSAVMALIGVAFIGLWVHLTRHPELLVAGVDPALLKRSIHLSMVGPIVYGLSIGLAFVSPVACLVVYALMAAYFAAGPASRIHRLGAKGPDANGDDMDAPVQAAG
jgi:uncharacterized membrane protein